MDNNKDITTLCQTLKVLNLQDYQSPFGDHYAEKLFTGRAIELHVLAQLLQLSSYDQVTEILRAHECLSAAVGLESISKSSLSRKIQEIPVGVLQELLLDLMARLHQQTQHSGGVSPTIGRLHLLDATDIRLPKVLGDWAYCNINKTGVRLHVRVVVADPSTVFPDKVMASTSNVNESTQALKLTADSDLTCVMDRGYEKGEHLDIWMREGTRFVVRIRDKLLFLPVYGPQRAVDPGSCVIRDVDGRTTKNAIPIRLVEFVDDEGRFYRVLTNRWDLTASEIAQIYKHRWLIELFFKWLKQHLNLVRLYGKNPEAVWNQVFCSLIAYAATLLVKLQTRTRKTAWEVLKLLQAYAFLPYERFLAALARLPTRTSRGRQKVHGPKLPPKQSQRIVLREISR